MPDSIATYVATLSIEQLHRLHASLMDRVYEGFAGGLSFGVDWSTLWAVMPGFATALDIVGNEFTNRTRKV